MKKIVSWLLFILWCLLIFFFSSQGGSESTEVSSIFAKLLSFLPLLWVRKLAHFFEFFVLGLLFTNLLKQYHTIDNKMLLYSFLFCLCYAISDEVHQLFVDGRAPRIMDVFIDFCGSSLGIIIYNKLKSK